MNRQMSLKEVEPRLSLREYFYYAEAELEGGYYVSQPIRNGIYCRERPLSYVVISYDTVIGVFDGTKWHVNMSDFLPKRCKPWRLYLINMLQTAYIRNSAGDTCYCPTMSAIESLVDLGSKDGRKHRWG